jgi:hypothetical protein
MSAATNSNESYCTFTLASDTTAGGLPSQEEIAKQLESNDPKVRFLVCCCLSVLNESIDTVCVLLWMRGDNILIRRCTININNAAHGGDALMY